MSPRKQCCYHADTPSGRQAHLAGDIAKALMAGPPRLLEEAPKIEMVDVLAAKPPAA